MGTEFILGDHNIACAVCGRECKASRARKHWQGFLTCDDDGCWEPRHPQDFAGKARPDRQTPIKPQPPPTDVFIGTIPYFEPYDPTEE